MSELSENTTDSSIKRRFIDEINELKGNGEYEDGNWLLQQPIKFEIKIDNQILVLNKLFHARFGSIPKVIYISESDILILLAPYQYKLLNSQFNERCDNFIEMLGSKRIFLKIYADNLGELIINLFSHIQYMNMLDIKIQNICENQSENFSFKKETLRIYLKINDNRMPLALGKKGNYIHFVNKFMECIHFQNMHLNKIVDKIQIFLRSEF